MTSEHQRPCVLICDPIAQVGVEMLQEYAEVDIKTKLTPQELVVAIGDYEAVITRSATQITAEVIDRGDKLKVIGRAGAGLDNIDVAAAQKKGVQVVNAPDANTLAVAEHTMALLLALVRHLPRADVSLKEGRWEKSQLMGTGLYGKTLGIIGFGRIGRQVALRAKAFGMRILVNQRRPTPELNLELGVEAVDMNDLLRQADFVTLHVPAKVETKGLIGADQLALMKPTACLINTARGTVIDETALLAALNQGRLAGAALDVFLEEPAINNALAQHERVIATPHIAASTQDAQEAAAISVAQQVIDILRHVEVYEEIPLSLCVVPMERVFPHEHVDPRRVSRLAERLEAEGVLSNPPIVIENRGNYVVLDGATRTAALKHLNYAHAVVQLITGTQELGLHTWFHAIRQSDPDQVVALFRSVPEIIVTACSPDTVLESMLEYGGLCYLQTIDERVLLIQPAANVNHLDALNKLTDTYIKATFVARTLTNDIVTLKREYPDLTALVVFPEYTVKQVLQIAQAGRVLPAGITRFIIPGRVLRLNADLAYLKSDRPLSEKNEWLRQLVTDKITRGQTRFYEEPVYLLDE